MIFVYNEMVDGVELVNIVYPVAKEKLEASLGAMTDEQYKEVILSGSNIPENALKVVEKTIADLPPHGEFHGAYIIKEDNSIDVDMPRARAIHMEELRRLRQPQLEKLDIDYQRALEDADVVGQASIVALKNQLRDMPTSENLDAIADPTTLKAFKPAYLEGELYSK